MRRGRPPEGSEPMKTVLVGMLGLMLAVAVGFGVHLITRDTISLPVVQLERPPAAPPTTPAPPTTEETSTGELETEPEAGTETEDSSGRGRGRGRGGNSGQGGGDD